MKGVEQSKGDVEMFKRMALAGLLAVSCGDNKGSNNGPGPGPGPGPGDEEGFYLNVKDSDGKGIPVTKFPSILQDGVLLDSCKKGEVFHLDRCWPKILLMDSIFFGFGSVEGGILTEAVNGTPLSTEWSQAFIPHSQLGDTSFFTHKTTFRCDDGGGLACRLPSFYNVPVEFQNTTAQVIQEIWVNTFFFFGLNEKNDLKDFVHKWFLEGTIQLKGRMFNFPLTVKDLKQVYPEKFIGEGDTLINVEYDWGSMGFNIEDDDFDMMVNIELPLDYLERRVVGIKYVRKKDL